AALIRMRLAFVCLFASWTAAFAIEHGQLPFTHGPVGHEPSSAQTGRSAQLRARSTNSGLPSIALKSSPKMRTMSPACGRAGLTRDSTGVPARGLRGRPTATIAPEGEL